ncbi:MAG TPA: molybdopterin-dependent oxidoreductase [Pirellulales bacterium]|nr:molybdopterin-dependent oxidoreductase [Pirellulales bacterium]
MTQAIDYQPKGFFRLGNSFAIGRTTLLVLLAIAITPFAIAYVQWLTTGLPEVSQASAEAAGAQPAGFPAWLRFTHYLNFFFMILLIRSGLQILMSHPRLYWNVHCTPASEWLRLTPVAELPHDRVWTANDDARHLSPWIGLPGYRYSVGMARHWHFLSALFWLTNGLVFVTLLCSTDYWRRVVPTTWQIVPDAWKVFVHYATFHLPPEPNGYYRYNALQQLAYFGAIFVLAPMAIVTGPSMSPAFTSRFTWYPRLPGNRQIGRSLHFFMMLAFVSFIVSHVSMVVLTGVVRNMNHIVVGYDDERPMGIYLGLLGIAIVIAVNALANWAAWRRPRAVQHLAKLIVTPVMGYLFNRSAPLAQFHREDISPYLWPNGKLPTSDEWKSLRDGGFRDYRLKIGGLVENPVDLSLEQLRAMGRESQITLHHCIQGWSGIAEWSGVPLTKIIELVRPRPEATAAVFYSYGEGPEGGQFYDSHRMENLGHSQSMLAYEMNGQPLPELHGAPLRLRIENQLGFKMVKWIESIEFVADLKAIYQGEGGYKEDHEYFGELANI